MSANRVIDAHQFVIIERLAVHQEPIRRRKKHWWSRGLLIKAGALDRMKAEGLVSQEVADDTVQYRLTDRALNIVGAN